MTTAPTVLVTGGAGFIGSHTCKLLRASGYRPVAFDNLTTGRSENARFGPLVRGDLRDTAAVQTALTDHGAVAVMHFAASAYVGDSMRDPLAYYDNNVGGMASLLRAMQGSGVTRIVFSSSCATYGVPAHLPITEDSPQNPINPYGRTKLIGEQMLTDQAAAHGLDHVALRYFNAAGADPEGELGEFHDPETHLIPLALMAASGRGGALSVFGTDYPTPDGTCIRDYIHVHDLARAHVLALRYLLDGGAPLRLNLGSGEGLSIRQIIAAIERLTGRPLPVTFQDRRAGDPPVLTADPSLARQRLGFQTELSEIDTILCHAAPWFGIAHVRAA
ncbi:UDP-L-arabinose 4-epimerase [Roseovarius azorensis]|uniref:UDP-glucose 4-epimerase n=1 Tax=Roseovarius azorensis TaxID=1287727 RepID=A0A1H7KDW9_9RHOB|nr:UDP-glucose 4-epimerase GalE [Roseovarius azorensis]SEK84686.1 UDP-L-arabinose 4-epimerase [Roseovarius azorensis]